MKLENLQRVEELQRRRSVLLGDLASYAEVLNEAGRSRPYISFYYGSNRPTIRNIVLDSDSETMAILALSKSRTERLLTENAAALATLGVEV